MAARVLQHHKVNPYRQYHKDQKTVVFSPNGYYLNILVSCLSPAALRVLFVLMARLQPDGSSKALLTELRKMIGSPSPTLSRALVELVKAGFITKRGNGDYWVNPTIARLLALVG